MDEFLIEFEDYHPEGEDKLNYLSNRNNPLYEIIAENNFVKDIINEKFNSNPEIVSFAVEEINLHNRLTTLKGVERDNEDYILVRTDAGDIAIRKVSTVPHNSEIEEIKSEIKSKLRFGQRIDIRLLEEYRFLDRHNIEVKRFRFRLSLSEIHQIIKETNMRGKITGDCHLIIYE